MTQKDKSLLLKDLCARLPYGVRVHLVYDDDVSFEREMGIGSLHDIMFENVVDAKPYLRPMSSMTEEEEEEYRNIDNRSYSCPMDYAHIPASERIDWLNAHHFDYRGLIERGLAIAVTEENNPYKE